MNAVQQAVELLQRRHLEASTEVDSLRIEIRQIEQALASLKATPLDTSYRDAVSVPDSVQVTLTPGTTITSAVRGVLDASRGPWSPLLVREQLEPTGIQGDRDPDKFISAIRTAMHTLRKSGFATVTDHNMTVATKWLSNAEAPVSAGASGGEESDRDSSLKEGGTAYGAAPPVVRADGPGNPDLSHDHGFGASLMEVSTP